MSCSDFFSANANNRDKCKLLQEKSQAELIAWEKERVSPHSPGPVTDDEIICRQIISPIHYDQVTKQLTATAFDDASDKGLSVNRLKYAANDDLVGAGQQRVDQYNAANPKIERAFWGLVELRSAEVRSLLGHVEGEKEPVRGFAIYDTANAVDKSHADVCQIVKQKALGRSMRLKLRDLANKFIETSRAAGKSIP